MYKKAKWTEENSNAAVKLLLEHKMSRRQAAETFDKRLETRATNVKAEHAPNVRTEKMLILLA